MEIWQYSASDLSRRIAARSLAPSEVMAAYLARIAAVNPGVNAVVSLRDADALLAEAKAADDAPSQGWLHGIPFAVKDLCITKGLRTTWGSTIFKDHVPDHDALLAARMRAAGSIFIGKTNAPEWGHGSHTFNPVFGATRNPYDLTRSAGGSSGGAAAGLAARLLPVADGSDMMGSLRNPAAFCNVYGFRPTWGLVPSDHSQERFMGTLSTDGPMGRTIEDVARLLQTQAGPAPDVPFGRLADDFLTGLQGASLQGASLLGASLLGASLLGASLLGASLQGASLKGKRIAWAADWGGAYAIEPGILDLCETALRQMEAMGAIVTPIPPPFPAAQLWHAWITLRAMLNANGFRDRYADPALRAQLKPETIWEIEQGQILSAQEVYEASLIRSRWYADAARLFETHDAVAMPSAQVWPFPVEQRWPAEIAGRTMDTYHRWMEVVVPVSLIGLPALSIPVGFGANGLPMGMQLAGAVGADAAILAMGQAWHEATDWPGQRPPPL